MGVSSRPIYSNLILMAGSPYARSDGMWIAKNIVNGFFAAPIEALPEISVTDVVWSNPHHGRLSRMLI